MAKKPQTIAIVGQGLMGAGLAHELISRGFRVVTYLGGRSANSVRRAADAGMEDMGSLKDMADVADLILSVLPSSQVVPFANIIAPVLPARDDFLYCDLSAKAPGKAEEVCNVIQGAGVIYIDGAITGPPPDKGKTNILLSGPHIDLLSFLESERLRLVRCGADPFAAAKLKMCISASTKARITTYLMALIAAKRMGIYDAFRSAQQNSDPAAWKLVSTTGPRMASAADRWREEFEEVAQMMREAGLPPTLFEGVAEIFDLLEASPLGTESKETLDPNRTIDEFVAILADWDGLDRG